MKKIFFFINLLIVAGGMTFAQETLTDKINKAYSLVGHWEIVKMDVIRNSSVSNPSTVPEASVGSVSVLVSSELGSYGSFDVAPGGTINGSGEAQYNFRVAAGSTAMGIPMTNLVLPVGGVAMMNGDDGVRKFTITGSADLVARSISLNAFKASGGDLKMIVHPGGSGFSASLWPPMSNVESKIHVNGSSLLLRASGVLSGIKVSFEAVKYIDMASIFLAIEELIQRGNNGTNGVNGNNGNNGTNGKNGNSDGVNNSDNNSTNNNNNSNNNNNKKKTESTNNGNPNNQDGSKQGPGPLVAGTVIVEAGGSANVVFKIPQAGSNYAISLTPMGNNGSIPGASFSDKTPMGFRVNVAKTGNAGGSVKVDWLVTPYTN
jgi:hypothetical protein